MLTAVCRFDMHASMAKIFYRCRTFKGWLIHVCTCSHYVYIVSIYSYIKQ